MEEDAEKSDNKESTNDMEDLYDELPEEMKKLMLGFKIQLKSLKE